MKAVCVCFEVHLPLPLRWYWPREGYGDVYIEKYFDMEKAFHNFTKFASNIETLNDTLAKSIENGGKYTLDISGIFLEQCKWAPEVIDGFRKLGKKNVSFAASPYYHSISCLFPNLDEFKEQVEMDVEIIRDVFGCEPKTFVNTELVFDKKIMKILEGMGFKCFISEGSHNIMNGYDPMHVYDNEVPTLLRHINLSEDLEIKFSDRAWPGYPLIADKFASWIASMEGDVITLYIKYDAINTHLEKNEGILEFLHELPLCLKKHGVKMLLAEEAVEMFKITGLSSLESKTTSRYGMHNLLGNHAQHLFMHELVDIGEMLGKLDDSEKKTDLLKIFRYLQQSEIFLEMNSEERRLGYERAVNDLSILSDIERAIIEKSSLGKTSDKKEAGK
ncbi:alpha-amylase [Methanolobus bombayensis]|uniref:alpha-amylase n=1 Tax=Methanolobus bombayensis TaxID=38023 RepID=UPI001AEA6911|nr:alpha-amylase [Methanolobus bombayensis]MBP1910631.1 alpha-amylase [Methanolobus bombayensis]